MGTSQLAPQVAGALSTISVETPSGLCRRCQSGSGTAFFDSRDYLSQRPFTILRCSRCGIAWTEPGDGTEDPSDYYPASYYGTDGQRFLGSVEKMIALFRQTRVREVLRYVPGPGRILDVGCGRGWMLGSFHRRGWTAVGVEKSLDAVVTQDQPGLQFLAQPSLADCALEPGSFQAVTLWHSLEHLDDPWQTLDEVSRLLAPGGVLVIEVPNLDSLQARWSLGRWFHLDVPRHRVHFTLAQLVEDLQARGLSIVVRRTFSLEYGPYGMWQSLLNLVTRQPNILYQLLRRQNVAAPPIELLKIALLLPVTIALGTPLELAAAAFRQGGIAHVVARKPL